MLELTLGLVNHARSEDYKGEQGPTTETKLEPDQDERKESPTWEFIRGKNPSQSRSEKS